MQPRLKRTSRSVLISARASSGCCPDADEHAAELGLAHLTLSAVDPDQTIMGDLFADTAVIDVHRLEAAPHSVCGVDGVSPVSTSLVVASTAGSNRRRNTMVTKKEDPYYSNTKGAAKKGLAPKPRPYKPPKPPK
jgi:hypothetical protein